ncbi:MBL fold metallo-hydrolase [Polluticoccus soli]|uniref:MBL fold metallo-hydrolase n=1 Tax=Polluticoccus soli TaxID=3034150 RepID=UPI0023E316F6|nr:MBL fold metallo-hydrolase [Flavipsychrobacter sp. JY13-12]
MRLFSVNAGYFKLDGGAMHGVVPKSMWNKANPSDENNMCTWAMRCLLIDHGNYRILVDTGMGTKQDEKFFSYYQPHGDDTLEKSLAKHGYTPEDITDVFLTHLHFDHCGGAIKREGDKLVPAFPNATYWSNEKHWQAATNPNEREKASFLKENILPLQEASRFHFIDASDGGEWIKDINIRIVNGHTDAMMLPQIQFNNTTILYCADLIPSVAHVSMPWVMAYDMRPIDTLKEKHQLLEQAVNENWVLFFEHDPKIECCTLQNTDRGIRVKETFTMHDLDMKYNG